MARRFSASVIVCAMVAVAVGVLLFGRPAPIEGQTPGSQGQAGRALQRIAGKPDFSGLWQTLNEANWDVEAHGSRPGAITQKGYYEYEYARVPAAPVLALGGAGIVPPSVGVVQGDGRIPYRPEMLKRKQENAENWVDRDPELRCYLPGIPRATYMPSPFQISQSATKVEFSYQFSNGARTVHLDKVGPPADSSYMGHSVGRWEGDTLVVSVTDQNDITWFDRAGNFHSDELKVTERYTPRSPDAIWYEATIEDPKTFTKPWTIAMPIYRRLEPNAQLLENRCIDSVEEFLYGGLRKAPVVTHWESATMVIDVKRRIPDSEQLYKFYLK